LRVLWAAAGGQGQAGEKAGAGGAEAGQGQGQGHQQEQDRGRQVAHPGRQLAAAFALGSQRVAVDHHPLDFELAKEMKMTLVRVGGSRWPGV